MRSRRNGEDKKKKVEVHELWIESSRKRGASRRKSLFTRNGKKVVGNKHDGTHRAKGEEKRPVNVRKVSRCSRSSGGETAATTRKIALTKVKQYPVVA